MKWISRLRRRRATAASAASGALRQYYRAPVPADGTPVQDLAVLALDVECTSLDLKRAEILSVGHVPIDGLRIRLGEARHTVVRTEAEAAANVTVHGLTDDVIASGVRLEEAVEQVLRACAGRVLLAHHARIETTLLSRACLDLFGAPWHPPVIDTMVVERMLLGRAPGHPDHDGLDLASARERHGLPRYTMHHALTDAIACAELFLAQVSRWPEGRSPTLRQL